MEPSGGSHRVVTVRFFVDEVTSVESGVVPLRSWEEMRLTFVSRRRLTQSSCTLLVRFLEASREVCEVYLRRKCPCVPRRSPSGGFHDPNVRIQFHSPGGTSHRTSLDQTHSRPSTAPSTGINKCVNSGPHPALISLFRSTAS